TPTTTASINGANLPSDTTPQAAAATYAVNDMANGTITPDQVIPIKVSDSEGNEHELDIDLLKTSSNTWAAEVVSNPASDTSPAGGAGTAITSGNIVFNSDGSLDAAATTLPSSIPIPWAASLGVTTPQNVTLNLGANAAAGTTGISQQGSAFAAGTAITDGTPFGNLTGVSIGNNGDVTATFDNGTSRVIAQVAMATFANEDGLNAVTGDAYQATFNSGTASINAPGSGGAGTLASNALESSTVDLSKEFTNLIITQRAYTASSKVITTADNMTQDLLQIIR
ncbi:MAG: flagellar hook-basal body complex protein, partial [Caulobacteraceae bacterium]|nr:flagellar hook-basal body complex protein [Caulobacteraceae bacterium]